MNSRVVVVTVGFSALWKRRPDRAVASTKVPASTGCPPTRSAPAPGSGSSSMVMPLRETLPSVLTTKSSGSKAMTEPISPFLEKSAT